MEPVSRAGGRRSTSNGVTRNTWREIARSNQRRGNQAVNATEINAAWMNNFCYNAGYLSNHFNEVGQHLAGIEIHPIASRIGIGQASVSFTFPAHFRGKQRQAKFHHHSRAWPEGFSKIDQRNGESIGRNSGKKRTCGNLGRHVLKNGGLRGYRIFRGHGVRLPDSQASVIRSSPRGLEEGAFGTPGLSHATRSAVPGQSH